MSRLVGDIRDGKLTGISRKLRWDIQVKLILLWLEHS